MMKNKLHPCCGFVYLEDHHNVDVKGKLVKEDKSFNEITKRLFEQNVTTFNRYYRYSYMERLHENIFVDERINILKANYDIESFKQITFIQSLEHFTLLQARILLKKFYHWLTLKGTLIITVPNIEETIAAISSMPNLWIFDPGLKDQRSIDRIPDKNVQRSLFSINKVMSLIYGSYRNKYQVHKWGYTFESLKQELYFAGFSEVSRVPLIRHAYPAIEVIAFKGK